MRQAVWKWFLHCRPMNRTDAAKNIPVFGWSNEETLVIAEQGWWDQMGQHHFPLHHSLSKQFGLLYSASEGKVFQLRTPERFIDLWITVSAHAVDIIYAWLCLDFFLFSIFHQTLVTYKGNQHKHDKLEMKSSLLQLSHADYQPEGCWLSGLQPLETPFLCHF